MSKMVRLGDISNIISGGTPSTANRNYWQGTIPWISSADLNEDDIETIKISRYISQDAVDSSATKIIPRNSVLVVSRVGVGKVAVNNRELCTSQDFLSLVFDSDKFNPKYLALQVLKNLQQLLKLNQGTSIKGILKRDLQDIRVPFLNFTEQKVIADLLSNWDLAIKKTERLIEAKENRFTWLIKTLINDQCHRWKHLRSERIFESVSEKNYPEEELLSVTQDRGVIPRTMLEGRVMSPDGSTASYKLIKRGDFVISLRSFQGGVEYSEYRGIVSPAYTVLRNKLPIHTDFYKHFFKSYIFIEKYLRIAVIGIRDGKQISMPDFKSVKLPYPPIEDQEKVAAVLNAAQKEIGFLKRKLELLKKQKRGLMQKLLTGQWRLK